jgi:hypothetical protein
MPDSPAAAKSVNLSSAPLRRAGRGTSHKASGSIISSPLRGEGQGEG